MAGSVALSLQTAVTCTYCSKNETHPFFVTLFGISADAIGNMSQPVSSRISIGRHPFKRQMEINGRFDADATEKRSVGKKRKRKRGWPHWVVICSVGPFVNGKGAQFQDDWQRKARKESGRLAWAVQNCQQPEYGSNLRVYVNTNYLDALSDQLQKHPDGRTFLARYMTHANVN